MQEDSYSVHIYDAVATRVDVRSARLWSISRNEQVEVELKAQMPTEKLEAFCMMIRKFERAAPDKIHVALTVNAPELEAKHASEIFKKMKMPNEWRFKRGEEISG